MADQELDRQDAREPQRTPNDVNGYRFTVGLWCYRHFVQGFRGQLPTQLSTARADALTARTLIDAELFARNGWRPKPPA